MAKKTVLPIPGFYDSVHAADSNYRVTDVVALQQEAIAWKRKHGLKSVGSDLVKISLLGIDPQYSFSFPEGSLFVGGRSGTGAMDDHDRLAKFIYRNLSVLSLIVLTMDTHLPFQIFHPKAHLCEDGSHPAPNTMISAEEYRKGKYRPNPEMGVPLGADPVWLQKQFIHYCEQLEASGKYKLTIWPYHCLLGSLGHTIVGVIDEARLFHSFARGADNIPSIKGGNPLTEHYSIFQPEVMTCWDGRPIPGVQKNTKLIKTLLDSDVVIITGQAKSHCLAWTIDDFLKEITSIDPDLAKKVYLLEDCTSSVVIPNIIDFTDDADRAFKRFENAGMNVVKSTDPIETWPGMQSKMALITKG